MTNFPILKATKEGTKWRKIKAKRTKSELKIQAKANLTISFLYRVDTK